MWVLGALLLAAAGAGAVADGPVRQFTDEEIHSMPQLFQLDSYERCLARPRGLYCAGSFRLAPAASPHRLFDLMEEYSADNNHFDRTLLHRGYCVSSRCPRAAGNRTSEPQHAKRFESCVAVWARGLRLRARLHRLAFCRTAREARAARGDARRGTTQPDPARRALAQVLVALLVCNAVGTLYDLLVPDDNKKNKLLTLWSVRSNWRRLTARYEAGDPRLRALAPLQGIRVLLLAVVVLTHAGAVQHLLYLHNPEFLEAVAAHPLIMVVQNGASVVQVFVMLSSFLLGYQLLLHAAARAQPLPYSALPKIVLHRVSRLAPLSLLVVGAAGARWAELRDGAQWRAVAAPEAAICRRKFWAHALFINNFVEPDQHCFLPTWFVATDLQLYAVSALLALVASRLRTRTAARLLRALFAAAVLANAALIYRYNWRSLLFIMKPEAIRTLFLGNESFVRLYTAPWGSLPAALLGLMVAHAHAREPPGKLSLPPWLLRWHSLGVLLPLGWVLLAGAASGERRVQRAALLTAADRPVFTLLCALLLYAICKQLPSVQYRFMAWHGWRVLARLSLPALLLHWPVNLLLSAAAPAAHAGLLNIFSEGMVTWVVTYLVAVPATLLVEMPCSRLATALL